MVQLKFHALDYIEVREHMDIKTWTLTPRGVLELGLLLGKTRGGSAIRPHERPARSRRSYLNPSLTLRRQIC